MGGAGLSSLVISNFKNFLNKHGLVAKTILIFYGENGEAKSPISHSREVGFQGLKRADDRVRMTENRWHMTDDCNAIC